LLPENGWVPPAVHTPWWLHVKSPPFPKEAGKIYEPMAESRELIAEESYESAYLAVAYET
jgi:hypothetical protein